MNQNPFPYEASSAAPIVVTRDPIADDASPPLASSSPRTNDEDSAPTSADADAGDDLEVDVDVEIVLDEEPDSSGDGSTLVASPALEDSEQDEDAQDEDAQDEDAQDEDEQDEDEQELDTSEPAPIACEPVDGEPPPAETDSDETPEDEPSPRIAQVDLVNAVRDVCSRQRRTGFYAAEGHVLEFVEGGRVVRITHPEAPGRRVFVPMKNVCSLAMANEPIDEAQP